MSSIGVVKREVISFARPTALDQTLRLLSCQPWCVLAGGTDIYPAHADKPLAPPVLDITRLSELRGITLERHGWRIGGLTTWTDILKADLPPAFDGLKLAAQDIGGVQIQNVGTIGGNLCNASPAADSIPPLMTLDASVELSSSAGRRHLPLGDFLRGYRTTAKRDDELLTAVLIPKASAAGAAEFQKLGARRYLVISVVMTAVRLQAEQGRVTEARVVLGACSPVAMRLFDLEGVLVGEKLGKIGDAVSTRHLEGLSPIDDVRATAAYRREAALELVRRALAAAASLL